MTTINTIEDLHKILTENAYWREAIRAALLGDELLQLPAKFDRFVEKQEAFNARQEAFNARIDRFIEQQQAANARYDAFIKQQEAFNAEQRAFNARFYSFIESQEVANARYDAFIKRQEAANARYDAFIKRQEVFNSEQQAFNSEQQAFNAEQQAFNAEQRAFNTRQETFNAEQQAFNAEQRAFNTRQEAVNAEQQAFNAEQRATNARQEAFNTEQQAFNAEQRATNARFDATIRRLDNNVGELKGMILQIKLPAEAPYIVADMGLSYIRNLDPNELIQMALNAAQGQALSPELRSFRRADLIIEAADQDGQTCYIPVEASYTVDRRDTNRAIRNAVILTQLTGRPAKPAVCGVYMDCEINPQIESGQVFWYETETYR